MSWRDVPMPTSVASLPTDKRGFPVPWVSCWHTEEEDAAERMRFANVSAGIFTIANLPLADCHHVAGVGTPDLGSLCPGNQLKGMLARLCDVCGGEIEPGPIFFMGAYNLLDGAIGFRECGVHRECAMYAGQVCPGLVVPQATREVGLFEATEYVLQPEFMLMEDGAPRTKRFLGFDDPSLLIRIQAGERMVLVAAYARPVNPTITRLSDWVSLQLNGSNA